MSTANSHRPADRLETFHRTLEPNRGYTASGKMARSSVVDGDQVGALDQAIRGFSVDGSRCKGGPARGVRFLGGGEGSEQPLPLAGAAIWLAIALTRTNR